MQSSLEFCAVTENTSVPPQEELGHIGDDSAFYFDPMIFGRPIRRLLLALACETVMFWHRLTAAGTAVGDEIRPACVGSLMPSGGRLLPESFLMDAAQNQIYKALERIKSYDARCIGDEIRERVDVIKIEPAIPGVD